MIEPKELLSESESLESLRLELELIEERVFCWRWFARGLGVCGVATAAILLAMALFLL